MIDIDTIVKGIEKAKESKGYECLLPYQSSTSVEMNEYCLFIKPDLTGLGKSFARPAAVILERLRAFGQVPSAAATMEASYLVRHGIMSQHYGVIDTVSKRGVSALSDIAQATLRKTFGPELDSGLEIYGAHEFLQKFPYFNPKSLAVLYDNMTNVKLAGGTHCVRVTVQGRPLLILNGFHPAQLAKYSESGATIVAFVIQTSKSWKVLRSELTGSTNPAKASPQSIRGALFARKQELGLDEVSAGANGVHVSAGPVEGMVEIMRFMSNLDTGNRIAPEQTAFGKLLLRERGLVRIEDLCANPDLTIDDKPISVFDLTEEMDSAAARDALIRHAPKT
jgi:hypothetical protein